MFFQVRNWEESKACVVTTSCSKEGPDIVPKNHEEPQDINGVDSESVAEAKGLSYVEPDLQSMEGAGSTATPLAPQLVMSQPQNLAVDQEQVPTSLNMSDEEAAVRATLEIVVEERIRDQKGNENYSAEATKAITDKIFQIMMKAAENHLKDSRVVRRWKESTAFAKPTLSKLKARTKDLIDTMVKSKGRRLEKKLSNKVAKRIIQDALIKLSTL